jgi:hypothetical protein
MKTRTIRISEKNYLRLQKLAQKLGPPPKGFRWSPDEVLSLALEAVEKQGANNCTKDRKRKGETA